MLFSEKVVIVTGAASGIGRAAALRFAREGATVTLADWSPAGESVAQAIVEAGGAAQFIQTDVSDEASVRAMVDLTVSRFGRLDAAFNNAGIAQPPSNLVDTRLEDWNHVIAVNLTSVFHCMKAEIEVMRLRRSGAIVNTASIGALVANRMNAAYSAAKAGVIGLTRTAAIDHAADGIRVNALCPGLTDTAMVARMSELVPSAHRDALVPPIGRIGSPEEVAAGAVWMCSDQAAFMTGQTLSLDGGYTAQ